MRVCQFRHFGTHEIQLKWLDWQLALVLQRRCLVSNSTCIRAGYDEPLYRFRHPTTRQFNCTKGHLQA